MRNFKIINKTYVKSNNSIKKIYLNYTYSLIGFVLLTITLYLIFGYHELILPLLKSLTISLIITSIFAYIINVISKNNNIKEIYTKDNVHLIAIIIGLFAINTNIIIIAIAILVSLIIKKVLKSINLSSALYGILIIILYKYFTNNLVTPLTTLKNISYSGTYEEIVSSPLRDYLIGTIYLSPILSLIAFLYLFHKKSIKYDIYTSYVLTFSFIMFIYGILNNMLWFVCFALFTGNILFLAAYTLPDYKNTPVLKETGIIYGIILGIMSSILRFIIPELAIIIPMLIGPLLLTKVLDNFSYKLKNNKKVYNIVIVTSIVLIIVTAIGLSIIY